MQESLFRPTFAAPGAGELPSVPAAVAAAWQAGYTLQVSPEDLAFLAGIQAWAGRSREPSLDEPRLREIYGVVSEVAHGEQSTLTVRATHAIARLREQHLLARVDAAGLVSSGVYALTRLGTALVSFFTERRQLSKRTLEVMMTQVRADLAQIGLAAAAGADWSMQVEGPLRLTVGALIEGIDQRQRGLDLEQEKVRDEIAELLGAQWFEAVERCEQLLETTTDRLRELHQMMMQEVEGAALQLLEIQEHATLAAEVPSERAAREVQLSLERIASWGEARLEDWSSFYQTVHGFIRSVVRVDRDRAVAERLRDQLLRYDAEPFFFTAPGPRDFRHLREPEPHRSVAPVRLSVQAAAPVFEAPDEAAINTLAELVEAELETNKEASLVEILRRLWPELEPDERDRTASLLITHLAAAGRPDPFRELRWTRLEGSAEVQELRVLAHE